MNVKTSQEKFEKKLRGMREKFQSLSPQGQEQVKPRLEAILQSEEWQRHREAQDLVTDICQWVTTPATFPT